MGLVYYGVHQPLALQFKDKYGLTHFIETGTWKGDSARWAKNEAKFDRVYTVEINPDLYREYADGLARAGIVTHLGDSRLFLRDYLPVLCDTPVLFWLDAHWSGEPGYHDDLGRCAALDEIDIINKVMRAPHVILVDDVHFLPILSGLKREQVLEALEFGGRRRAYIQDDVFIGELL